MTTPSWLRFVVLISGLFCGNLVASEERGTDEIAAVLAADRARGVALLAADLKALDVLLADDLRYTHSNGKLETKAIHLGTIADGLRYARFSTSDLHGHLISPDVVVLTGKIDQQKVSNGKASDTKLMFQAVWRRMQSRWQLASMQTAIIPVP